MHVVSRKGFVKTRIDHLRNRLYGGKTSVDQRLSFLCDEAKRDEISKVEDCDRWGFFGL